MRIYLERRVLMNGFEAAFVIDEFRRLCLLKGGIGLSLRHEAQVASYENSRARWQQTFDVCWQEPANKQVAADCDLCQTSAFRVHSRAKLQSRNAAGGPSNNVTDTEK